MIHVISQDTCHKSCKLLEILPYCYFPTTRAKDLCFALDRFAVHRIKVLVQALRLGVPPGQSQYAVPSPDGAQ